MIKEHPTFAAKYAMNFPTHSEATFRVIPDKPTFEEVLTKNGEIVIIASGSGGRSLFLESLQKQNEKAN